MNITISDNVTPSDAAMAGEKFNQLMLYLGIRSDNCHVLCGRGGNNWLLCVLAEYEHVMMNDSIRPWRHDNRIIWGTDWLKNTKICKMRAEVDSVMDSQSRHAVMSLILNQRGQLRPVFKSQGYLIPEIDRWLQNKPVNRNLTWQEQLIAACLLCEDIADSIDKAITAKPVIDSALLKLLISLQHEIILLSIRWKIGIDRLIRASLDEDPILGPVISDINRILSSSN